MQPAVTVSSDCLVALITHQEFHRFFMKLAVNDNYQNSSLDFSSFPVKL